MRSTAVHYPMISIQFDREQIPVETFSPSMVPDEKWSYIDKQGHAHLWDGDKLPTLTWVVTGTEWIGDEYDASEIEVGEYRCRHCSEVVEPQRRADYGPRHVTGLATFAVTIDREKFVLTEAQYAASVLAWRDAIVAASGGPRENLPEPRDSGLPST